MAKSYWIIVFATFLISSVSLTLLIVSMCTPYWIVSSARNENAPKDSEVNYGLFSGSLTRYALLSGSGYELGIICDYGYEACIYSCQQNADDQREELRRVLNRENVALCPTSKASRLSFRSDSIDNQSLSIEEKVDNKSTIQNRADEVSNTEQYIHPGYWASTVAFLSISIIFTAFAAIMSIVNVIYNPVEIVFSIFGLYLWNGIAIGCMVLVLILWGSLYETSLKYNIAITDTLRSQIPYTSDGLASLGYSFWIIFVPLVFSGLNMVLLWVRKYLIEKRTPPPTITVERNDYTIMLY